MSKGFELADGSMSTEYEVGDYFEVLEDPWGSSCFSQGSIVEFVKDDQSNMPQFQLVSGACRYNSGEAYEKWNLLNPHKKASNSLSKDSGEEISTFKYQPTEDDFKAVQEAVRQAMQGCSGYECKDLDKLLDDMDYGMLMSIFRGIYSK